MKLLLDTHAFIWMDRQPERLPPKVFEACSSGDNELFLSLASIWEMQIKLGLGKLQLGRPLRQIVEDQYANGVAILPVKLSHLWTLADVPPVHSDPFDRMLVAQAMDEKLLFVSGDSVMTSYPVKRFWE